MTPTTHLPASPNADASTPAWGALTVPASRDGALPVTYVLDDAGTNQNFPDYPVLWFDLTPRTAGTPGSVPAAQITFALHTPDDGPVQLSTVEPPSPFAGWRLSPAEVAIEDALTALIAPTLDDPATLLAMAHAVSALRSTKDAYTRSRLNDQAYAATYLICAGLRASSTTTRAALAALAANADVDPVELARAVVTATTD